GLPISELGVREPELRDAPEEGHLAAFELEAGRGAGTRAGALLAAAGSLAPGAVLAPADALAGLVLAGLGGDVVDHHGGWSLRGWARGRSAQACGASGGVGAPPSGALSAWAWPSSAGRERAPLLPPRPP